MPKIVIYTDGASKGNPGPGGWGALVAYEKRVVELGGAEDNTTNNRMELRAVWEALALAREYKDAQILLYTDSAYVMNGATKWGRAWKARGWMTKEHKPVLNRDMWEPFLELVAAYAGRIEWNNIGGHVGIAGNERVDAIASGFALGEEVGLYNGDRAQYGIDIDNLAYDPEKHQAKSESRARSKQKAYSYVSEVDGIVKVHTTWSECETRVRGKKARFKKAVSAGDEAEIIRKFSQ
jgi:ribonuclease HI